MCVPFQPNEFFTLLRISAPLRDRRRRGWEGAAEPRKWPSSYLQGPERDNAGHVLKADFRRTPASTELNRQLRSRIRGIPLSNHW